MALKKELDDKSSERLKKLEKEISNIISTEIGWIPLNSVKISIKKSDDIINFFDSDNLLIFFII